ncbi:unnamed protein product [Euphydryas editha]|uniref:Uncharacterized protein n=1 Tax=Euphydryas editha TaxID=104508 RepID=A0AAU9TLA3_EUPED|nr:unnamed protein product [Euphydryas editha]
MELMSSLLLYALATLVPQALGKNNIMSIHNTGGNVSTIVKNTSLLNKDQVINMRTTSSSKVSNLQSVFMDVNCKSCIGCMERAIKSHKSCNQMKIEAKKFHDELINSERNIRYKRKTNDSVLGKFDKKTKKNKSKNNRFVTITKYNEKERVYALKVIESNTQVLSDPRNKNKTNTCQIYSVKKSFPCESPEADLILKESKRKINKKNKKEHKRDKNVSAVKTTVIAPVFRKRQIDESQAPEQIMPSVEEFY